MKKVQLTRKRPSVRSMFYCLVAASALVIAGCGSSTSTSDPTPTGQTGSDTAPDADQATYDQGVTDDTIKIGVLGPFSGDASVYSKAPAMGIAMFNAINESGGINGRKIEIVQADTKCDASAFQGIVRKFVEQDKVFMIYGGSCSNAIISAKPLVETLGVPLVTINAASAEISDPPVKNLFHVKATSEEQAAAIVEFIKSNTEAKTLAFAATSDEWGQTGIAPIVSGIKDGAPGIEVATQQELDPEGGDPTPSIQKMLSTDPDMAVVFAYPQPMTTFLKNARPQGLDVPVISGDGTRPDEQAARLGDRSLAENFFTIFGFTAPLSDPSHDEFKDLFLKENPGLDWDTVALEGATSAQFVISLLEEMGNEMTWDNFISTAETIRVDSVSGELAFAPFDADDRLTRRPGIKPNFTVLDPKASDNSTIVVTDWPDWLSVSE